MKKIGIALATLALACALPFASAFAAASPNSDSSAVSGEGMQQAQATSPQTGALDPACVAGVSVALLAGAAGCAVALKRELR